MVFGKATMVAVAAGLGASVLTTSQAEASLILSLNPAANQIEPGGSVTIEARVSLTRDTANPDAVVTYIGSRFRFDQPGLSITGIVLGSSFSAGPTIPEGISGFSSSGVYGDCLFATLTVQASTGVSQGETFALNWYQTPGNFAETVQSQACLFSPEFQGATFTVVPVPGTGAVLAGGAFGLLRRARR